MCCHWKRFVIRPLQIGGSVMMWCDASLARIDQLESRGGDESDAWSIPQSPPAKSSKSNTLSSKPPDPGIWWKLCIVLVISLSWANIYKWVSLSVVENWFAVSLTMTTCVCSFTTDPEIVGIGYNDLWFITYRFLYLHNVSLLFRLECCTIQYVWSPPDCFLVLPLPFATRATPMFGSPLMIRRPPLEYDMTSVKSSRCSRISMWMEQVHVI